SLYPVAEYLFKHPLTQEVALASQLQERRKRLHAAVARVIEAAHAKDLDQQAALLAHHWEEAADLGHAVRWHRRAAEWAFARDPVEGLRHWRKVRDLGRSLNDADAKESRLRACGVILASGSWRLGMSEDEVRGCSEEARSLAQELGRPSALAAPLVGFAGHLGMLGRAEAALELAEEARAMLNNGMDPGETFQVETAHAYWLFTAGRLPQALEAFDRIVELSGGDPQVGRELIGYSPLMWAEMVAGWMLAQAGRFDQCWPRAERAIRMAREHHAQENLGWALGGRRFCAYLARGTSRVPVTDLRRASLEAVEIAEAVGIRFSQIMASSQLAIAFFLNGDYGASEERFTEALAQARGAGTGLDWQAYYLAIFADSCLARGDAEAAIARAREGIEAADAGGAWFQAALARTALVDALVYTGAPEHEVAPVIAAARELVRKSSGNSLLPRLREAEARLAGRRDRTLLQAGLREAEAMYRAMGAPDPADRLAKEI